MFRSLKPLVIRINDVGRAEAVNYESFEYKPQDAEIRYFLMQFVTRHYGRRRAAVREDYASSLYFLDGRLADSIIESNRKNKTIERFLAGEGDEIEIIVRNVSIEDLRTPPYKATVDSRFIWADPHLLDLALSRTNENLLPRFFRYDDFRKTNSSLEGFGYTHSEAAFLCPCGPSQRLLPSPSIQTICRREPRLPR